jgi:hypothetical protein
MAAAMLLNSLENDVELSAIIQSCYEIQPFTLEKVTNRLLGHAILTQVRAEHQSLVMKMTGSDQQSKSSKKWSKKHNLSKPKVVPPTSNQSYSSSTSASETQKFSTNPTNKFSLSTDTYDKRLEHLEYSIRELTQSMMKLTHN